MAADAAEAGVLVTAVGTGVCDDGQAPTFATLTLAWVQTRPFRADLDLAQLAAGPEEEQTQFETSLGTGVLTSEYNDAGEAGRQRTGSR